MDAKFWTSALPLQPEHRIWFVPDSASPPPTTSWFITPTIVRASTQNPARTVDTIIRQHPSPFDILHHSEVFPILLSIQICGIYFDPGNFSQPRGPSERQVLKKGRERSTCKRACFNESRFNRIPVQRMRGVTGGIWLGWHVLSSVPIREHLLHTARGVT